MVIVSLDSHDPAGYQSIRGGDGFLEIAEGIRSLKKRGGCVMLSPTLQKRNVHDLPDFIAFSKTLNVDRISVRPVDAFSSAFGRGGHRPDLVEALTPGEEGIDRISRSIEVIGEEFRWDFHTGFLKPGIQGLRMIRDYFLACRGRGDFPSRECDMPFISLTVEAGGGVKPCFFLEPFADIYEIEKSGWKSIIESEHLAEVRRLQKKGEISECRRCVQPYSADF